MNESVSQSVRDKGLLTRDASASKNPLKALESGYRKSFYETDLIPDCDRMPVSVFFSSCFFPASEMKLSVPGTVQWPCKQSSTGVHFLAQVAKAKDGRQSCPRSQEERTIQGRGHLRLATFG